MNAPRANLGGGLRNAFQMKFVSCSRGMVFAETSFVGLAEMRSRDGVSYDTSPARETLRVASEELPQVPHFTLAKIFKTKHT